MTEIVIVSGSRTPIGDLNKSLSSLSASDLGASAICSALEKAGISPLEVDMCIMGQVLYAGEGSFSRGPLSGAPCTALYTLKLPSLSFWGRRFAVSLERGCCQPWETRLSALREEQASSHPFVSRWGHAKRGWGWHCNKKQVTHFLHAKFAYLSDFYAIYFFVIFYFDINPPAFPLPVLKSSPLNPENPTLPWIGEFTHFCIFYYCIDFICLSPSVYMIISQYLPN